MTIEEVLREMREMREINSNFRVTAEWASAIEAAMREPKAYISHTSQGDVLDWEPQFDAPSHTKLFALPPNAAAENDQWQAAAQMRQAWRDRGKEIDKLQRKLMLVTNFPSHPGGHPDDRSEDAMVPEDWRHGWICAVAAIQDALAGEEWK